MKEELQLSNKHNYSQYSNKKRDTESGAIAAQAKSVVAPEVKMEPVKPIESIAPAKPVLVEENTSGILPSLVNETTSGILPSLVNETVETAPLPKTVTGVVVNCSKLNVRAEPSLFADVVAVLDAETEFKIDVAQSNRDWFKICTAIGVEGYCMSKFVNAYM